MKKALSIFTILITLFVQAQWKINFDREDRNNLEDQKRFSYGYFIGLNYFDFKIHPDTLGLDDYNSFSVESHGNIGFSAGLLGKMKINEYFDLYLQPGIHFTERKLYFNHIREGNTFEHPSNQDLTKPLESYTATAQDSTRVVKSSYIDLPILIEFHGDRWFNTRPYLQAGAGYALNLQSNESSDDDNEDGVFRLKSHSYNWQLEAGVNIYFNRFKLTPSIKGIFFLNNELKPDDPDTVPIWAGAIKSLSSRAIMLSLKFE